MEPYQNRSRKDGNTVETKDYIFAQAANGHVQVFSKKTRGMVLHITITEKDLKKAAEWHLKALDAGYEPDETDPAHMKEVLSEKPETRQ